MLELRSIDNKNNKFIFIYFPTWIVSDKKVLYITEQSDLIFSSVKKTNRCVVVEENWPFSSVGTQVIDRIQCECFDFLDSPILRVSQEPVPVPYNENLEKAALPSVEKIIEAIKKVTYI